MTDIWKIIERFFDKMPQWVQVSTFLVLLFLCVYLYLVPTFANGQLVAITESGGRVPYRGADMAMHVGGRNLKFKTNEIGYWSIPVVSRFPGKIRINIYHEDQRAWYPIVLGWMDLWSSDFEIRISNQEPYFDVELVDNTQETGLINQAHSAELIIPEDILSRTQDSRLEANIRTQVYGVMAENMKTDLSRINDQIPFSAAGGASYINRIQIIGELEQQFDLVIPDEHWRSIDTVGSLVDYVYKRKLLERDNPNLQQTDKSWPQIQQSMPSGSRATFQ